MHTYIHTYIHADIHTDIYNLHSGQAERLKSATHVALGCKRNMLSPSN